MGGSVSRSIAKKVTKPIKNINILERAEKATELHKTKPKVAPKHPSTEQKLQQHLMENPHLKQEVEKKDIDTIERMNRLKLQVTGKNPEIISSTTTRPLPQNRDVISDPYMLSENPEKVPHGKLSWVQVSTILDKHKKNPTEYTAKDIAKDFHLDLDQTYCLLKYYYKLDLDDNQLLDFSAVQKAQLNKVLIYQDKKPS